MNLQKKTTLEKVACFIVDKRKIIYLIYAGLIIFSVIAFSWVGVNNDLSDYLSEDTETRRGLSVMKEEFTTYASANIMVDNISYATAQELNKKISEVYGVKEVAFDNTEKHFTGASAMYSITFISDDTDSVCSDALQEIRKILSDYDTYTSAELGDTKAKKIEHEVLIVMLISAFIIIGVLLLTSKTYLEIPVLILTFLVAAILNKGSNFIFGTISFVSNSVSIVLQLALAIDYAIILCHRYTEERETKNAYDAVVTALCKSIPEIAGSCLTTLSGLAAMTFMHYKIGFDLGIVLIKAITISILTVFTLMPGMLMSFSPLIDKTHHKQIIPKISIWGKIVVKLRYITPVIFLFLAVAGFFISNHCPYAYTIKGLTTFNRSESQIADEMIYDTFEESNMLAVLFPKGNYASEKALISELEKYPQISSAKGLASTEALNGYCLGDELTPRQFSELCDVDIEKIKLLYGAFAASSDKYGKIIAGIENYRVPLIDMFDYVYKQVSEGTFSLGNEMNDKIFEINDKLSDGKKQLIGNNYSRIVLDLNLPEESDETFAFLDTVREEAKKQYGDNVLLVGNSTSNFDLKSTFAQDNILIAILSILFVLLVLLLTFKSAALPFILISVIQGSIWINFSFPAISQSPIFFLSYLVVSSIQMGANIDYAIVITNRFQELRKTMPVKDAVIEAVSAAFPTIITSGTILASAGFIIGFISSEPSISSIGICLGRGTVISIVLVMLILPQLLLLGYKMIDKTGFSGTGRSEQVSDAALREEVLCND